MFLGLHEIIKINDRPHMNPIDVIYSRLSDLPQPLDLRWYVDTGEEITVPFQHIIA